MNPARTIMAAGRRSARSRTALVVLLLLFAGALSGCTQVLDVGRHAVVVGLAVDGGPGSGVTATVQMYHHGGPSGEGGAGGGAPASAGGLAQPIVQNVRGSGENLAQAVVATQLQSDSYFTFWATDLVLFGAGLAKSDLAPCLDYLLRDTDLGMDVQVAVAQGGAGALMQTPKVPSGIGVEVGERLLHADLTAYGSVPITFWRFMSLLSAPYRAAWAPVVARTATGYRAAGTAVFRGDRLVSVLDPQDTNALGWIVKRGGFGSLSFRGPEGKLVTVRIVGRRVAVRADSPAVGWLTARLFVVLQQGSGLSFAEPATGRALENDAAAAAKSDLRSLVDQLQSSGSDVVGFGAKVRAHDPAAASDWPTRFAHMRIHITVTVRGLPSGRLR